MSEHNINLSSMLSKGSMLRGVYRIDSYLSSGGFGNTYVATNVEFDEVVAIKEFFMRGVTQRDANNTTVSVSNTENKNLFEEQLQKFKKEARRLRKMKSSHVVSVHDLFEENGTAYYVMDFIDGENLSIRLKRLQKPLGEKEVMGYLPQILEALECVHKEGIWHLDLKPANIMVDRKGKVSLIDFGASKQRSNTGGATTSTAVSFTNGFAPREQMEQNLEKFGPWTDLYALGATLYNLLSNKRPPMPSDIDDDRTADKHLALPLPADVSETTRRLILKLMTTDRLDRPQSVEDVRRMIDKGVPTATEEIVVHDDEEEDTMVLGKEDENQHPPMGEKLRNEKHQTPSTPVETKPTKPLWQRSWALILGLVLAVAIGTWLLFSPQSSKSSDSSSASNFATVKETTQKKEKKTATAMPFKNALGDFTYTGELNEESKPQGMGEAKFKNGSYYKGQFLNGNLDGANGSFKFKNGDTFTGSFKDNFFHEGTYTVMETGEVFKGSFKNGNPSHGIWYDKNGMKLEEI